MESASSAFTDNLLTAFGAGNLNFSLSCRDPADGFAVLASEIFMLLILKPLPPTGDAILYRVPPIQEFRVFRPAFGKVP